ncbi:hypothetical protein BCR44DRAFT_1425234 [Catenaria anguillulae PL171]|uniref:Alpha/Beta hydrolase protein n=1 Tax=Catenaria anguillulae PL171 TaxID=765915 RepID=A0A1Y2I0X5_9FUNG|nr:hypothetical protein BCR44DRAFT_1425234 [Catenaria anguillulae PL171]
MALTTSDTNSDQAVDVLLFGWADGHPAHVAKYASRTLPGPTRSSSRPKMTDFFLQSTHSIATSSARTGPALNFLETHGHLTATTTTSGQLEHTPRPLIAHCFSNGGRVLRPILYGMLLVVDVVVHRWLGVQPRLDVNCDTLLSHSDLVHVPKLVMYSSGDALVRPWHVEKFLDMLTPTAGDELVEVKVVGMGEHDKVVAYSIVNGRPTEVGKLVEAKVDRALPHGGLVSVVRFPKDSPHVQHLRKYPEEYRSAVARFIELTRI